MTETVVFLPGLLCDGRLWRDQIAALPLGINAVVADLTLDDTLDAMAGRVLAAAPARFALCSLSMGGYAALALMRLAPERVTRLCLMDTSARPDTAEQSRRRRGLMGSGAGVQHFRGVTPRLLPQLVHPDRLADTALTGDVMAMAERVGRAAFLRQQTAILGRPDSRPGLAGIAVPTLVAVGAQDVLTPPEHAREMAAAIPSARYIEMMGCGHLAPMERPDEVSAMVNDWLGGSL